MNNDWKEYLLTQGATQDSINRFVFEDGYPVVSRDTKTTIICDLSHYSTVVIAGPDALEFMQGQFTNDAAMVNEETSQISGFCNNKGRMIANFRLFQHQQNYFISINNTLVEQSITHLQNYILRAQVAIQDISEQLIHLGISGDNATELVSQFIDNVDSTVDSISHNEDYIAICIAGEAPRYEIFCAMDKAQSLWESLSGKALYANSSSWNFLNIENGLPFIDDSNREAFVPQMANMELINGVSFEKGCYTGQEIVARTHYLGKQKRRTYHLKINTQSTPVAGDALATETSTENQYTGTLVNVEKTADGEFHALAVLQIKAAETEKLKLKLADAEVDIIELPYSLEEIKS